MHDMTQGSVRGHVLRMTAFMLAGMFFQTLYGLIDIYWVSRLGKEAVAAVAVSSNLMFVTIAISQMIGVGAVALVAHAAGRKEHADVQRLFNQAQCLAVVTGVLFLAAGGASMNLYADKLSSDAVTADLAKIFLSWFIPALSLQFTMVGLGSALRGIGNMKPGMVAQIGSVVLNMVLAPFLIFGWLTGHPLGVAGAALATFLATVAAVVGLVWYLRRSATYLRINWAHWSPDWKLWGRMIGIGLPSGAEFLLMSVLMGVIYAVIRSFGAEAQAGFGIGGRIMQAGFMPAVALSFAVAAVAGQNYGGRQFPRVKETFIEGAKLNVIFMLAFTLLCHVAPAAMMRLFSKDPAVVDVGADYLRIISYNYVAFGLIVVASGIFQGLGNTWPSLAASALRLVFFIPLVVWLSRQPGFTLPQVWWISVATVTLQMALSLLLLRREFGRKLVLAPAPAAAVPPAGAAEIK
jgi:putative MATE family efflux protein